MRAIAAWLVVLGLPLSSLAQSAAAESDPDRLRAELHSLAQTLRATPRAEAVLEALPAISAAMRDPNVASDALPVIEQAAAAILAAEAENWPIAVPLLKFAARAKFEQADPVAAEKHLKTLLELYRAVSKRVPPPDAMRHLSKSLNDVAAQHLRYEQLDAALKVLGEVADLESPLTEGFDDGRAMIAGGLNRRLEELAAAERYELLYRWAMPTAERRSVRVLTALASTEAPPSVFARALGERPRATSFPVPEIGGVPGLFSTAWTLVRSAAEAGQLRRLTKELTQLTEQKVRNAEYVLVLAQIVAAEDSSVEELRADLERRLNLMRGDTHSDGSVAKHSSSVPGPLDAFAHEMSWAVIGAACLPCEPLRQFAHAVFERMLALDRSTARSSMRPFVQVARAVALIQQHAGARRELLSDPELQFWIPANGPSAEATAPGALPSVWLSHEDHILHLAGGFTDYLCFRYPVSGDFEFQCEAQDGGPAGTEGNIAFGGLVYETDGASGTIRVWDLQMRQSLQRPCPFVRREQWATFQRLSLKSSSEGARLSINGHPIWTDPAPQSNSPWIALWSFGDRTPVFRGLKIIGSPVIPREVRMSDGNVLRGWISHSYPRTMPTVPLVSESVGPEAGLDWHLQDGVIHGAQNGHDLSGATQSRLSYFRPLQNGEAIRYEFLYEPGQYEVHPALGRLTFLIEPGGVKLHWMTIEDREWTGLPDDNAVVEPLNRRGPRALPLKYGEWNRVTIALAGDVANLTLNDTLIYSRKLEADNPRTFSHYHDRNKSAARARNVIMHGDWPDRLTSEQLANLAVPREADRKVSDRHALGALFAERHVADSALVVHRRAAAMPLDRRYSYLASWVLPGPDHGALRLAIDFTPTHPSPAAVDHDPIDARRLEIAASKRQSSVQTGGNLVAPAVDLIESARQLKRLDPLREQVAQAPTPNDAACRARLTMLALIDIAREDFASANDLVLQLLSLVEAGNYTQFFERWPETLAIDVALRQPATREAARELLFHLYLRQVRSGTDSGSESWRRQMLALVGLAKHFDLKSGIATIEHFTTAPSLRQWHPVSRTTARTRGSGFPRHHWQLMNGRVDVIANHDEDYLYYQSPLRGDYELECDVPAFGWQDTQLYAAGLWAGAVHDRKSYQLGSFCRQWRGGEIVPPLTKVGAFLHYRTVVREGASTTYVNGRRIHEEPLLEHFDPWLAIRCNNSAGGALNLRITGNPEIPSELWLTASNDLNGWIAYFNHETVGGPEADWRQLSELTSFGGIVGGRQPDLAGSFVESLFRYHRPMLEDGTIEYDFYYRQGESHCHPALDRLVFLLGPGGVRVHWITDGVYDRTELSPDNAFDEPHNRRGLDQLPLKLDAWNRLALTLKGDTVHLVLNGRLIYQRDLEATNQRTFGLFHYADQTEARVRNVAWRGNWPHELPSVVEQELAGPGADFLDNDLPDLADVFQHDFARQGSSPDLFSVLEGDRFKNYSPQSDGLHANRDGKSDFQNATISPRLEIRGDFDITLTYDRFQAALSDTGTAAVILRVRLDNSAADELIMVQRAAWRAAGETDLHFQAVRVRQVGGKPTRSPSGSQVFEADGGALRLARRGDIVYFLITERDSQNFRLVRSVKVAADEVKLDGIRATAQIKGPGRVDVVWKTLTVRAERLSGRAVMNTSRSPRKDP